MAVTARAKATKVADVRSVNLRGLICAALAPLWGA
jgi:hypothetical protein